MDRKTFLFLSVILFASLGIGAAVLAFNTHPGRFAALGLYAALVLLFVYINSRCFTNGSFVPARRYLLLLALALSVGIQLFDATPYAGFYFVIISAAALFHHRARFSAPFTAAAMLLSMLLLLYHSGFDFAEFWRSHGNYLLPRMFMLTGIVIARYAVRTGNKNRELAEKLQQSSLRLEDALDRLQANMQELKDTADLRAREALMQELHDRLGHLLTTASIGMQAVGVLIGRDAEAAKARLELAAGQIQQAVQSLRHVMDGTPALDEEGLGFTRSLMRLIGETETHADVAIRHNLRAENAEALDALPVQTRKFLFSALTEGLTNGIQHGAAKNFMLSLICGGGEVSFRLRDDGSGFDALKMGYGLLKMRREAQRLGAALQMDGSGGCMLDIRIPPQMGEAL